MLMVRRPSRLYRLWPAGTASRYRHVVGAAMVPAGPQGEAAVGSPAATVSAVLPLYNVTGPVMPLSRRQPDLPNTYWLRTMLSTVVPNAVPVGVSEHLNLAGGYLAQLRFISLLTCAYSNANGRGGQARRCGRRPCPATTIPFHSLFHHLHSTWSSPTDVHLVFRSCTGLPTALPVAGLRRPVRHAFTRVSAGTSGADGPPPSHRHGTTVSGGSAPPATPAGTVAPAAAQIATRVSCLASGEVGRIHSRGVE